MTADERKTLEALADESDATARATAQNLGRVGDATRRVFESDIAKDRAEARAKRLADLLTEVDRLLEGVEGFGPSDDESLDAVHTALTAALSDPTPGGP